MPTRLSIALNLCQVLEEEFENLHGPLDDARPGPTSPLVRKDWLFHEGHVVTRGERSLAAALSKAGAAHRQSLDKRAGRPVSSASPDERDLATFLAVEYPELLKQLEAATNPVTATAEAGVPPEPPPYVTTLNEILRDARVFRKERFVLLSLRDETRGLLETGWQGEEPAFEGGGAGGTFASSDLARFRRLLLEDALPEAFGRVYDIRLERVLRRIHALPRGQSALCFSGGGIRSGSFALGVLQGLARHGLLNKFDYLSTVSGGGYIGGWLTGWIHRHPGGLEGVIEELKGGRRESKLQPEPAPLRYLRDYSSFLTPRTGLLSADTWTFVGIYVRNLLLNWSAMIPLLLSVLMIPRLANTVVLANPLKFTGQEGSQPTVMPGLFLILGTLLSGYVLAFMRLNRPSNGGALRPGSFWARNRGQGSFLKWCFLPLLLSGALLTTYWAWLQRGIRPEFGRFVVESPLLAFALFGLAVGVTGGIIYLVAMAFWRRDDEEKKSDKKRKARGDKRKRKAREEEKKNSLGALRELGITAVSGVVAAALLYVIATKIPIFNDLGADAFKLYLDGTRTNDLLPFTHWYAEWYTCLAVPAFLLVFFLGTTLFIGFTSRRKEVHPEERRAKYRNAGVRRDATAHATPDILFIEDEDREWLARFSAWLFIAIAGWGLLSALVMFGPLLLIELGKWLVAAGGLSGLLTVLGGRSAKTPSNSRQESKQGLKGLIAAHAVVIASFVFIAFFVTVLSLLTSVIVWWLPTKLPAFYSAGGALEGLRAVFEIPKAEYGDLTGGGFTPLRELVYRAAHFPTVEFAFALAVALQVLGRFMARIINLNKFSLHAGYRDRIIRAFLGASRLKGERRANPFTGFDPRDNLYMHELRPGLLSESDFNAQGGLNDFVGRLCKVENLSAPPADADECLRQRIREIDGQSEQYFSDGKTDAADSSFKSALFADLNRILQTDDLDKVPRFLDRDPPPQARRARRQLDHHPRGDYRVFLNRLMLEQAYPRDVARSSYPPPPYKLLHVVCMALNLVGGGKLAWQHRKAETFTASPLHSGSFYVGYRRSRDYGGRQGISLGTAVAVSGAAASSNMGYFSPSPVVTFVLTLFNARLGWWLGNPGVAGSDSFYRSHPKKALSPIIDEAFGLTDDRNEYVLLSDGGHFENLALYEMVLRRCRHIVVVDGSADPAGALEGLGDAVRKIRIDLGIRIEFESPFPIYPRPESEKLGAGGYCAVGDILYNDVDDDLAPLGMNGKPVPLTGKLVYIKPTVYGTEPRDIYNYAQGDQTFPHESTADQFFDEPQFESHRMLGSFILEQLCREAAEGSRGAANPCEAGDLPLFVEWLGKRAEEERRKKGG